MNYILELLLDILSISFPYALLSLVIFLSYQILKMADLTAEGSFTLGGVVTLTTIVLKCNPLVSTLLAIIFGFMAGVITGVLHTKLKIPSGIQDGDTLKIRGEGVPYLNNPTQKGDIFVKIKLLTPKKISQEEFYSWSEEARQKKELCDHGNITLDEFKDWLKK